MHGAFLQHHQHFFARCCPIRPLALNYQHSAAATGNGNGPLVGREPSAEDRKSPTKEKLMSKPERKGNSPDPEPLPTPDGASSKARWVRRARRLRNEAGLHLFRGAATAVGGAVVAYCGLWIQSR